MTVCAPYLWPEQANELYGLHEQHFWRTRLGFYCGPVISGLGWPLGNGALMVLRILSDSTDATYTGEAAIVYNMIRRTAPGITVTNATKTPVRPYVYILMLLYFMGGILVISTSLWDIWHVHK